MLRRLAVATAVVGLTGCGRGVSPTPAAEINLAPNPMYTISCDTSPMKPLGRRAQMPAVTRRRNAAALTGLVVQKETGDAIQGAVVDLRRLNPSTSERPPFRYTDLGGGFSFDSISPGSYSVRVRRIGEKMDTATIQLVQDRVDTLVFRLQMYRCYGY